MGDRVRRVCRVSGWGMLALAVLSTGVMALSFARTGWVSRGGVAVGVKRGAVEIGVTGGILVRRPGFWTIQTDLGSEAVLARTPSLWSPRAESLRLGISSTASPTLTLTTVSCPVWLLVAGFGGTGIVLWRAAGRVVPAGHCRGCGYDLRGLSGERCPECGKAGLVARMMRALRRRPAVA